ncbi:YitT family protein [uncultured Robinsoniella sp.]|uniref:YczE/YyaS/YitT family protein n=1 Tax=uncultured Robinsoniella sp. TaxID=904190 RepID=UPI00374EC601
MQRHNVWMKKIPVPRLITYFPGFVILTLGQRLFVEAGFGAASLDALCVGLAGRLGLTAGIWIAVLAVGMMFLSAALLHNRINPGVLVSSFIFGILFDFWGWFFHFIIVADTLPFRLALYIAGIICGPLGTAIYFQSELAKSALDEFIMSVKEAFHLKVKTAKTVVEAGTILLALCFGGPIGAATILTGILYGPLLQLFLETLQSCRTGKRISNKGRKNG